MLLLDLMPGLVFFFVFFFVFVFVHVTLGFDTRFGLHVDDVLCYGDGFYDDLIHASVVFVFVFVFDVVHASVGFDARPGLIMMLFVMNMVFIIIM